MDVRKPDLYVVTSLLHTDALSILTGEVCGRAGTQLQMDTENIFKKKSFLKSQTQPVCLSKVACVVLHLPRVKAHWKRILVLHCQCEMRVVVVLKHPNIPLLVV